MLTVASPSYIKAHGKPRHPKEIEERDCIDFYDAANARPYGACEGYARPTEKLACVNK